MRSRLPLWPMLSTVLGVAAMNALIGYGLALALGRGPILAVEPLVLIALAVVGVGLLIAAVGGWRAYLRRTAR